MVSHAVNISNQYPPGDAAAYRSAALALRLPYWDWASDPIIPDFMGNAKITVNGPTGPKLIDNPLYSYRFQNPVPSSWGGQISTYQETIRCLGEDGLVNNITAANMRMVEAGSSLKDMVVRFLPLANPLSSANYEDTRLLSKYAWCSFTDLKQV